MQARTASLLLLALLAGCVSPENRARAEALAGTSWTLIVPGKSPRYRLDELIFGPKLSPVGFGEVRIGPERGAVTYFSVIDDNLVLRLYGKAEPFEYEVKGNVLRLGRLGLRRSGVNLQSFEDVQTYRRNTKLSFSE